MIRNLRPKPTLQIIPSTFSCKVNKSPAADLNNFPLRIKDPIQTDVLTANQPIGSIAMKNLEEYAPPAMRERENSSRTQASVRRLVLVPLILGIRVRAFHSYISGPAAQDESSVEGNWGMKGVKRGEASKQVFTRSERTNQKSTNQGKNNVECKIEVSPPTPSPL